MFPDLSTNLNPSSELAACAIAGRQAPRHNTEIVKTNLRVYIDTSSFSLPALWPQPAIGVAKKGNTSDSRGALTREAFLLESLTFDLLVVCVNRAQRAPSIAMAEILHL
jgi:hypothetical protein